MPQSTNSRRIDHQIKPVEFNVDVCMTLATEQSLPSAPAALVVQLAGMGTQAG